MKIKLNGVDMVTHCTTLEDLVMVESHQQNSVATALNGEFVAIKDRADTLLSEGDAIEIIAPMSGG